METAKHVDAHLLYCDTCTEMFYALERAQKVEAPANWREILEILGENIIGLLAKQYGAGNFVGLVRIIDKSPAYPARAPQTLFKTLELPVAENVYHLKVSVSPEIPSLECQIRSHFTPRQVPLDIIVRSETGEFPHADRTDSEGAATFVLSKDQFPESLCVFTFALESTVDNFLVSSGFLVDSRPI